MDLLGRLFTQPEPLWIEHVMGRSGIFEAVAIAGGHRIPVVGTRLAREGIVFDSPVRVRGGEIGLTFFLRRRSIRSRVRILREEFVRNASRAVHSYVCAFTAMTEDDRTAVSRYVDGLPELRVPQDPRVVSSRALAAITGQLVRLGRLAPPSASAPLIKLATLGWSEAPDGRTVRDVSVSSRLRAGTAVRTFETQFRIYSDGEVVLASSARTG
ncbi:MAG TPA: hypothetical protein VHT53_03250 [Candidatus Elarobacter sp.]|jgi:hypothetical protein|nr:hypothetical protein [Candidatus Elarobacter sp.]